MRVQLSLLLDSAQNRFIPGKTCVTQLVEAIDYMHRLVIGLWQAGRQARRQARTHARRLMYLSGYVESFNFDKVQHSLVLK